MRTFLRATLLLSFCILLVGTAYGQTPTTTIQNGGADTRLELNYDGGFHVPGTFGPTTPADSIPATGAGARLMWYPAKAAFRAGRVFDNTVSGIGTDGRTFWNPANVGNYSVAFGNNTRASGDVSFAAGINTVASGTNATALGVGTEASGSAATAMGNETTASAANATALGLQTTASGIEATALGSNTVASDERATAIGDKTAAEDFAATAIGSETVASGVASTAMGGQTTASAFYSTAMGYLTTASGESSVAMGESTTASGLYSLAVGDATTARIEAAAAMGTETVAATYSSVSIGRFNDANRGNDDGDPTTGPLFVVGNGESGARSDALVLDASGDLTINGTLTESSDRRLKTSIRPLNGETMAKLSRLRPVRYRFKNQETHPSGEQIGLIAQDVREELPALVSGDDGDALSLSYSKFTAVLLKGLQEQHAELTRQRSAIDSLRDRVQSVEALRAENQMMKKRLAALEADRSPSAAAGWTGSSTGVLLGVLLGGLLGAGLLWRRRH